MGRKRRDCPVFGCTSKDLVRLANHLDQIHDMDTEERAKWLKWSKLGISMPLHNEETATGESKELQLEKTLQKLLKRQEDMENNFNNYLTETRTGRVHKKQLTNSKCSTKKRKCSEDFDITRSRKKELSIKWLCF